MKIKTGLYGEMEPSSITYTSVIDRSDWEPIWTGRTSALVGIYTLH
jgi:hypothetical protein